MHLKIELLFQEVTILKLKKEFEQFYKDIRIDGEQNTLIQKRKVLVDEIEDKLPEIMSQHDIKLNKSDIRTIDQGSYKYNTTIRSEVVDRDVAVIIPLDTDENPDPRKIKGYLRDSIDITVRTVQIKEPCVRAAYHKDGEEYLHIDLPLYAQDGDDIYLARGKEYGTYSWEPVDPDGLNEDLCEKINGNEQLRRVICYLKKWKNVHYANAVSDHEVPPSIGLTYLACDCFVPQTSDDGDDDLLSLQKTIQNMCNCFSISTDDYGDITSANISRKLTVKPHTDIFKKMNESSSYVITFYKRLRTAKNNLLNALNVESEHDAAEYVVKVLGTEFDVPPKPAANNTTQSNREHSFG